MKTRWMLSSVMALMLSGSFTDAQAIPGEPVDLSNISPISEFFTFKMVFNEFGDGYYQRFDPSTGKYGDKINNPGTRVGGFLQFLLPSTVESGDVAIFKSGLSAESCQFAGDCSDGLRFFTVFNQIVDVIIPLSFMQFFSDNIGTDPPDPGNPDQVALADTGFPNDFNFASVNLDVFETNPAMTGTGENVFEEFLHLAPTISFDPSVANAYDGVSDGPFGFLPIIVEVPEPSSIWLLIFGLSGLCLALGVLRKSTFAPS
jgi:hypothetical protein